MLLAAGTMAHSYVEAFPSEVEAFCSFAEDLPGPVTFLVDTYDVPGGYEAAIRVIRELGLTDHLGVRIDSGDLARLARETRGTLDGAGLGGARIFVSGGLDEYDLERFRREGVPIDAAGVGTRMGVSADACTLDNAYKLVEFGGRPVLKLSAGKATLPDAKQVWRRLPMDSDVLAEPGESGPAGSEPLLRPVMRDGRRVDGPDTIEAARLRLTRDLAALPERACDLRQPSTPDVVLSSRLRSLRDHTAGLHTAGLHVGAGAAGAAVRSLAGELSA